MKESNLDKAIKIAEEACKNTDAKDQKLSLIDKMRPWVHLQNLLYIKHQKLIENDKKDNK